MNHLLVKSSTPTRERKPWPMGFKSKSPRPRREAGILFPVFLTRAVYDAYLTVPPGVEAQDEAGRLHDILTMLRFAIHKAQPDQDRLHFALYVRNDNRRPRAGEADCYLRRSMDIDEPKPAITVMLPEEE
jgi:hypothetical protein